MTEMFAGRLRELRTECDLSQKELADKVGVTVRQISRLETAAQVPTWPTVLALCAALGVECTAFTLAAKDAPAPERGRPRKAEASESKPTAKRAARKRKEQP